MSDILPSARFHVYNDVPSTRLFAIPLVPSSSQTATVTSLGILSTTKAVPSSLASSTATTEEGPAVVRENTSSFASQSPRSSEGPSTTTIVAAGVTFNNSSSSSSSRVHSASTSVTKYTIIASSSSGSDAGKALHGTSSSSHLPITTASVTSAILQGQQSSGTRPREPQRLQGVIMGASVAAGLLLLFIGCLCFRAARKRQRPRTTVTSAEMLSDNASVRSDVSSVAATLATDTDVPHIQTCLMESHFSLASGQRGTLAHIFSPHSSIPYHRCQLF